MSSFLQNQPVHFNDYTPQYDVGLYGQIGRMQEGKYDAGVQQAQSYFSSVAGLDIAKPEDKEYLQQKINQATTAANQMGGADFSEQANVGKIGTLAAGIYNDQNVQAAVGSTLSIKAYQASQKEFMDKHPDLYTNAWKEHQDEAMNSYFSSHKVGETYRGPKSASAYTKYAEDLDKMFKDIDPTVTTEISPDGQFQVKTNKRSTITDDRIKGIMASYMASNPGAQESMLADAKYSFKGATPQSLAQNITNYTQSTITQLAAQNEQYLNFIKNNPGNVDYVADVQKKILDNKTLIASMQEKQSAYLNQLSDPNSLDRVKFGLFTDNFTNGYLLRYKKDDIERSISENFNAVHTQSQQNADRTFGLEKTKANLTFLKEGLDPSTGQPLTPDSPYYAWYLAYQAPADTRKKAKNPDGSAAEGGIEYDGNPQNASGTKDVELDGTSLQAKMAATHAAIGQNADGSIIPNSPMDNLRQAWYRWAEDNDNAHGSGKWKDNSPQVKAKQFDDFYKQQEASFVNGGETMSMYKEFRDMTYADQSKLNSMVALDKEAKEHAAKMYPDVTAPIKPVVIGGLSFRGPNGNVINNVRIDPKEHSQFIVDYNRFSKDYESIYNSKRAQYEGNLFSANLTETPQAVINATLKDLRTKYAGNKNFDIMYALLTQKGSEAQKLLINPVQNVVKQRIQEENNYLREKGKSFNDLHYSFSQNAENVKAAQLAIYNDMKNASANGDDAVTTEGEKYSISKHKPEDIVPLSSFRGTDGRMYWEAKIGNNKPFTIVSTQRKDQLPNSDPYDWMVRDIDIYGATPSSGAGAVSTYSGRVRVQIAKGMRPGTYQMSVISKGSPQPVELHTNPSDASSPIKQITHPKQVVDAISQTESDINKRFGIRCDSDDVLKLLTSNDADFTTFIKSKYKK